MQDAPRHLCCAACGKHTAYVRKEKIDEGEWILLCLDTVSCRRRFTEGSSWPQFMAKIREETRAWTVRAVGRERARQTKS